MKLNNKKKVGLVLSGGGVKAAAFHIGVCLALKQKGFRFKGGFKTQGDQADQDDSKTIQLYVGSSAGAFISSILAAGYSPESLVKAFEIGIGAKQSLLHKSQTFHLKPLTYFDLFKVNGMDMLKFVPNVLLKKSVISGGLEALIKNGFKINGLFSTRGLEKYLRKNVLLENHFSDLRPELFIVATQLNHSRKVIFGPYDETTETKTIEYSSNATVSQAVAASTALPPVYAPYPIYRTPKDPIYYFDGEIRDTLSTHVAEDHGADLVIASYSLHPYHYNPEFGSLHKHGAAVIINQALYQVIQQKIVKHMDNQERMAQIYSAVDGYLKNTDVSSEVREKLLEIIRTRVNYKPETDHIYIHPRATDYETFLADHFSLNPKTLENIAKAGFKAAINTLRAHNI